MPLPRGQETSVSLEDVGETTVHPVYLEDHADCLGGRLNVPFPLRQPVVAVCGLFCLSLPDFVKEVPIRDPKFAWGVIATQVLVQVTPGGRPQPLDEGKVWCGVSSDRSARSGGEERLRQEYASVISGCLARGRSP